MTDLLATCWCEAKEVKVSSTRLANGETDSCGRPECHPPGGAVEKVEPHFEVFERPRKPLKDDLTPSDREMLADDATDSLVRYYLDRYGDDLGARTEAFRKVAAAARAEADALLAVHAVSEARRLLASETTGSE